MPYTKQNYPDWLKGAPTGVIDVFVAAFNSAWEDYADNADQEGICQRIARAAIKKAGWSQDKDGKWHEAGEAAPAIRFTGDVLRESAICETAYFEVGDLEILEAEADGFKRIVAPLLRVGFSKNKAEVAESRRGKEYPRYYGAAELERVAPLVEGMTIYVGYDEHNDPVDVPKELGVYEGARFDGKAIRGAVKVFQDQNWVVDRLRCSSRAFGGLSIEGGCERHALATVNGQEAAVVQGLKIARARLVKNPAAAGAIEGIRESDEGGEPMDKLTLQQLKESFPGVYDAARAEFVTEADVKAKDAKIADLTEAVAKKDVELKAANAKLHEAESVALVEAAFPRTKDEKGNDVHALPQKARDALHESLKGETDPAKIAEAVKKMADILTEATAAGKPQGTGTGGTPPGAPSPLIAEAKKDLNGAFGVEETAPAATAPATK